VCLLTLLLTKRKQLTYAEDASDERSDEDQTMMVVVVNDFKRQRRHRADLN
jgi:hypothetical protein